MTPEIIRFSSLPVSLWRNGAGRKADICSTEEWNVGFAWLEKDAPFSDFTGVDRTITLIDGPGFSLVFADHPTLQVDALHRPSPFDGGWATQCHVDKGACMVLNVMTARDRYRHSVSIADADAIASVDRTAAAIFAVLLTGSVSLPDGSVLQPRDAIRINGPA